MSRSASGHLTLTRLGESTLYAPTPRDTWVFLLWDSTDPPGSLPLDDTWADQGLPAHTGWYVYLRTALAPADAAAAEQTLRSAISRPAATGCAWSTYHPGSQAGLLGAVPVRLDKQDRPVIATDTPVMLPSGVTSSASWRECE